MKTLPQPNSTLPVFISTDGPLRTIVFDYGTLIDAFRNVDHLSAGQLCALGKLIASRLYQAAELAELAALACTSNEYLRRALKEREDRMIEFAKGGKACEAQQSPE